MNTAEIKWRYSNLPIHWLKTTRNDFVVSQEKYDETIAKLKRVPKDKMVTIFSKDAHKLYLPQLKDTFKIQGIDFTKYFDAVFSKEDYNIPMNKDLYVIYNVGLEKALNKDFAGQLLRGLLTELQDNNKIIYVASELNYSEFFRKYEIEIKNKISLKQKEEERII